MKKRAESIRLKSTAMNEADARADEYRNKMSSVREQGKKLRD
jgi:hypothetical protein